MSTSKETKIYACEYIHTLEIEGKPETKIFGINVVLFEAEDEEEAYEKALYGIETRDGYRYKNDYGEVVRDGCLGIKDIEIAAYSWKELTSEIKERDGFDAALVWLSEANCNETMITPKEKLSIFNPPTKDKKSRY